MTTDVVKSTDIFPTVLNEIFKPWNQWPDSGTFSEKVPRVNIAESKDNYAVSMAVPGMKKDDFKIDVNNNMLTICAEKEEKKEEDDKQYNRKEYNHSSFSRSFTLPDDAEQDEIQATYDNGVLWLLIPKKEEAKKAAQTKSIVVK